MKKNLKPKELTLMGLLAAVLLVMSFTPLGFLTIGPLAITLNMIPVAIGAIALGPKGGAVLGDGWSAHDYDYAGIYLEDVSVINCTYTVAGVEQPELPLYNYVK
jgi:thiamine transporter ThiT